ncbi:ovochymase-1-like [Paramacrobiotus metropolitanus]|uniref:ovochymase-1-like n=1 Tax=Paramacrobiotus metropolitanus TaxID=2943436 RepID=UPI002445E272|nr:ovochymase-1-like [Paramacrobiotus metropolitanus]
MFVVAVILLAVGVTASANGQVCGGTVTVDESSPVVIQSPNYPEVYPHDTLCTWTVRGVTGKGLLFNAITFGLEGFPFGISFGSCSYLDHLTIGKTAFCGAQGPNNHQTGTLVVVTFRSDGSVADIGFQVSVSIGADLTPGDACGGDVDVEEGKTAFLLSPGFPATYSNNLDCTWIVTGPTGKGLQLNTVTFDSESDFDFLALYETVNGIITEVSRSSGKGPNRVRSVTNGLTIVFRSDDDIQGSGFNVSIEVDPCPLGTNPCPSDKTVCVAPSAYCNTVSNECPGNADEQYCHAECGIPPIPPDLNLTRIVGGAECIPHSWPWQVAFLSSSGSQFCGGSLISDRWVMTAAHCCSGQTTLNSKVLLGGHRYASPEEGSRMHTLRQIILHPSYGSRPANSYDFCLLELNEPTKFSRTIAPVCLASVSDGTPGSRCYVTGWGNARKRDVFGLVVDSLLVTADTAHRSKSTVHALRGTAVVHQVDVTITESSYCNSAYNGVIDDSMVCAAAPGKDTCQGDSGGPLVCDRADGQPGFVLVGVTSWGRGCAQPGYPGVYGRIAHVLDWITESIYSV